MSTLNNGRLKDFDEETAFVAHADKTMWSNLKLIMPKLPRGCETLLLELFCGVLILTTLAATAGWTVSQPADVQLDGLDLLTPAGRRVIDQQIEAGT